MDFNKAKHDLLDIPSPELIISGSVNPAMYEFVVAALAHLRCRGSPDLKVIIDSTGGDVSWGLDIYDQLRLYRGKKRGEVMCRAASMAAIILQACDVRACARHATVLIHHISLTSVSLDELIDDAKLKKLLEKRLRDQDRLNVILSERSGKTIEELRVRCLEDRYVTSEEALEFGLIDEII